MTVLMDAELPEATAEAPASATPPRRRRRNRFGREQLWAVAIALPVVLTFLYFSWGPIVSGLVLSFQHTNFVQAPEWVGWDNFAYVLTDPLLSKAIVNTLWYGLLCLLIGFPLPIILAVAMSELRARGGVYSVLAYLPVIFPPVVSILLWKVFFDPAPTGLFNTVLGWFGWGPLAWLNSATTAMPSLVLEATWAGAGTNVIIFLAALTAVRNDLYEAAELDGAGIWRRIWHITLPQIRGIIVVLILLQIIGTAQVFSGPFLFTNGGPDNATLTVLLLIYNYAFVSGDYGAATALSVLLAVVLALFAAVYNLATRKLGQD
ncbi:carbohydrate ABC transporter permease [Microbacterium sp. CIAB417]|uniref:carbohydrate ABC transporter permease n=1 Tax=Microbacterium sp. CIAB417 TaxID=2860287 RepID=UPI001FAB419F|nr:sugar ABC transporter permease [Microbacterium sp. CIAB417]